MQLTEQIVFPPFRLDVVNEQLWCEHQRVPLRPKTFAVLRYLVEQAGRLVTKEEVLKAVWSDTQVSEGILKGYIRDLREVLGDDAQRPRFIETIPRRGHRFIGPVVSLPYAGVRREQEAEECFLKAIDIARQQQAKSLELRAMMSLVRLRQQQTMNHRARTLHPAPRPLLNEGHQMLSAIYRWFTEGFDTKDLQDAKALLEELRQ